MTRFMLHVLLVFLPYSLSLSLSTIIHVPLLKLVMVKSMEVENDPKGRP